MSDNIIQVNKDLIHTELKNLVKNSIEETLNAMLDAEAVIAIKMHTRFYCAKQIPHIIPSRPHRRLYFSWAIAPVNPRDLKPGISRYLYRNHCKNSPLIFLFTFEPNTCRRHISFRRG